MAVPGLFLFFPPRVNNSCVLVRNKYSPQSLISSHSLKKINDSGQPFFGMDVAHT